MTNINSKNGMGTNGLMNDPFEPMNGLFGLVIYFEIIFGKDIFWGFTRNLGIKKQPV
jgi:hypothetical protein